MSFDAGLVDMIMRLRGRGISDNAVLRAIELVPRKRFVPLGYELKAYTPGDIPLPCGQTLPDAQVTALMLQFLKIERDQKVLICGLGSGYMAGIASKMTTRIYTVERYKTLIRNADEQFKVLGLGNIVTRHGDGRYGWPGQAPFDRIILGYGLRAAPDALLEQLAPNGRMIGVIDEQLTLFEKARKNVTETILMPLKLDMCEAGKSRTL